MNEYIRVCRFDHWLKNVFIVFGHAVAFVLVPEVKVTAGNVWMAALSLLPACFIASANYILNEILDAPFDRLHPTKKHRGVAAGLCKVPVLWAIKALFIAAGFGLSLAFFNWGYTFSLLLLLISGVVYNIPPIRLKDRAFVDVIAESFNNPIRLWLGWFALVAPADGMNPLGALLMVPVSITLSWWAFGALLMTGKRYSEFRFIADDDLSGQYRKSFKTYTQRRLIMAMITYANLFCFCAGVAIATYQRLHNLAFAFPLVIVAIIAYFRHAMSEVGARLEPEQLLQNKWVLISAVATGLAGLWLVTTDTDLTQVLHLMRSWGWDGGGAGR